MDSFLCAQILGIVALILVCYSYFASKKTTLLLLQVIANVFYATAFLIMQAYAGGIIVLISTIRCIEVYYTEKKNFKNSFFSIIIYGILYILSTTILWQSWLDIIPLISSIIFTIAFAVTDMQKFRLLMIFPNAILVVYSILYRTYVSALLDFIELVVLIIAIVDYNKIKNKNYK